MALPATLERERTGITRPDISQGKKPSHPIFNWSEVERLGINNPAPEGTRWKAMQKYIGVRRGLIRLIDDLMRKTKNNTIENPSVSPYIALLSQRRELSGAQRYDRLRLTGRR